MTGDLLAFAGLVAFAFLFPALIYAVVLQVVRLVR